MRKLLCKIFDHKYRYYLSAMDTPSKQFRCCKNCGQLQEYKTICLPFSKETDWFSLTQRTKFGADKFLCEIYKEEQARHSKEAGKNFENIHI